MAPTVATKVFAAVITSSPGLIPNALREILIASVPLPTPTAYFVSNNSAKDFSNSRNGCPRVKSPVATNFLSSSQSSGQS